MLTFARAGFNLISTLLFLGGSQLSCLPFPKEPPAKATVTLYSALSKIHPQSHLRLSPLGADNRDGEFIRHYPMRPLTKLHGLRFSVPVPCTVNLNDLQELPVTPLSMIAFLHLENSPICV